MEPILMSTAELLDAWRDATRAAELAARLAREAEQAALEAEAGVVAAEEIAELAERVAEAANAAAAAARAAADRAAALALDRRVKVAGAQGTERASRTAEDAARSGFHDAEDQARERQTMRGEGAN